MPSLWKKQKTNRISRLLADLQTNPKRGNHLVVETGFPTSVVDIFVKNHDKLKKSSKKKHRSKQPPPSPTSPLPIPLFTSADDQLSPVSDSPLSLSILDVPSCSIDLNVEEIVAQKNPRVELNWVCCDLENEVQEQETVESEMGLNSTKSTWLLSLKGALIVTVAMYTRSFVLGISIGALLLCLLECLGGSVLGFFKPCEDVTKKLRSFAFSLGDQMNGKNIGIKKEKECEDGFVSTRESIDLRKREIELGVHGNKTIGEIEIVESNICESVCACSTSELCGVKRAMESGDVREGSETVTHNGQVKKGKKFWNKFVPKQSKKKKKKHRKGQHHIEEISPELEEGNELEDEQEMVVVGAESSFLLEEQERGGVEHIGNANYSNTEMLHINNGTTKSSRIMKKKNRNLRCLGILGITLAGLTGGRVFALVLTVISCILFKIMRG